jgi:hypothetical protein
MKGWPRSFRAVLASAAIISVSAGVTFAALTALGVTFGGGGEAQETQEISTATASAAPGAPSVLVHSPLAVSNRDRLAICVESVNTDSSLEIVADAAIEAALPAVVEHPTWIQSDYQTMPSPIVERDA